MEDIYCDIQLVIDEILNLIDESITNDMSFRVTNVNHDILKDDFGEIVTHLLDNSELLFENDKKILFKYEDSFIIIYYKLDIDNITTIFEIKICKSEELAINYYNSI